MIKAVVFDLDDTLYLEADFVRSGFRSVGAWCQKELGLVGFEQAAWTLFAQGRRGDIFDAVLSQLGIAPGHGLIRQMVMQYREHTPDIALPRDSAMCLQGVDDGWKLGLITDGPLITQENKIRALRIDEYFDEIIITSVFGEGFSKPHERSFKEIENKFGAVGEELVYVADNPAKDFVVPSKRGWRAIRVKRELGLYKEIPLAHQCDGCVPDLRRVPEIIRSFHDTD
jgi:putative hydrolase of the HAD superfamily